MQLSDILDRGREALEAEASDVAGRLLTLDDLGHRRRFTPVYTLQACDLLGRIGEGARPRVADALVVALALSDWSATTVFVPLRISGRRRPVVAMLGVAPTIVTLCERGLRRPLMPADRNHPVARYAVMLLGQTGIPVEQRQTGGGG